MLGRLKELSRVKRKTSLHLFCEADGIRLLQLGLVSVPRENGRGGESCAIQIEIFIMLTMRVLHTHCLVMHEWLVMLKSFCIDILL